MQITNLQSAYAQLNICEGEKLRLPGTGIGISVNPTTGLEILFSFFPFNFLSTTNQGTQIFETDFLGNYPPGSFHSYVCGSKIGFRNLLQSIASGFELNSRLAPSDPNGPMPMDLCQWTYANGTMPMDLFKQVVQE